MSLSSSLAPVPTLGNHWFNFCPYCCCYSDAELCLTHWDPMDCSILGFPVLHSLPEFAQTQVHWVNDTIQPSHPLSSPSPPARNLSQPQGLFQWVSSLCICISSSNEYSGLISFMTDWFDLFAIQGTLKSLLQHHSLKASILWWSAFFMVQLSHPCMTTIVFPLPECSINANIKYIVWLLSFNQEIIFYQRISIYFPLH